MPILDRTAAELPVTIKASSYTLLPSDVGTELQFLNASAVTVSLPPVGEVDNGYNVVIRNIGAGTLTIDPSGSEQIDGVTTLALATDDWQWIRSDATEWKTIASGSGSSSGSGKIVQIVNDQDGAVATGTTTIPSDDTIPQNTEGDEYMSLSITPTSATNKLKIDVVVNVAVNVINTTARTALFQDSTANALAAIQNELSSQDNRVVCDSFTHYMEAGTTDSTTFKVRCGGSSGTLTFNGQNGSRLFGGVIASSITITEIEV